MPKRKSVDKKIGNRKYVPLPKIQRAKESIPVSKAPEHALIYSCDVCGRLRMYGKIFGTPSNQRPLLVCFGDHSHKVNEHFPHTYSGTVIGGEIKFPSSLNERGL